MDNSELLIECVDPIHGCMSLKEESVQCCIASLPALDQKSGESVGTYVIRIGYIFDAISRVMVPRGTLWINVSDAFAKTTDRNSPIKKKDLMGIPWEIAFELRKRGWYLRQDIILHRPNCTPESVKDRCTRSYEHIFMFSKRPKYYYKADAIREFGKTEKWRNRRDVWVINNKHERKYPKTRSMPPHVIATIIRAATTERDIVLAPFAGCGDIPMVSNKLGRQCVAFEADKKLCQIANTRIEKENLIIDYYDNIGMV